MSEPWLVADSVFSPLLSYGILISFTVFFILLEWKRKTPYLSVRIISVLLMMVALAGFLIRPLYKVTSSEQIILLTPDYNKSQVDSLLSLYPTLSVFHSPGANSFRNSIAVKSYHDLTDKQDNIAFIMGQGLPPEALDLFEFRNYQFISAPYPEGIIRLSLPDNILPNRKSTIEGIYNNRSKYLKIFLEGPGGKEDSVSFSSNGFQYFKLSFLPKEPGKFLYTIHLEDSIKEKVPVRVKKQKSLNILFIQHYPTFETRYLKEFLGNHHRLLFRYQISKNRYRYEFVNRKSEVLNQLSKESLSDFDLLIIDSDALQSLGTSETKNLQSAIEEGLGMLTVFNSSPSGLKNILPFKFKRFAVDTAHINPGGSKKNILPAWPFSVQPEASIVSTVKNKNRVLSGYTYNGFGKIGFQLLQETYRLILQGDSIGYHSLWSGLLEQISRSEKAEFAIHPKIKFPFFTDSPIPIEIISSEKEPELLVNNIRIPLKENRLIDNLWSGKFWTDKPGWNKLTVGEDSTAMDLYISYKKEWRSLAIANNMDETRREDLSHMQEKELKNVLLPVPQWIFYCFFLLGAGFLWLAPKL